MVISVILNILDAIEETFHEKNRNMRKTKKVCNMIFSPIWPVYTIVLMSWANFRSKIDFGKEEENKDKLKRLIKISNHAHLTEVCTESSLQPLVQFFIIFNALRGKAISSHISNVFNSAFDTKDWSELVKLLEDSNVTLQLWSFVTSVGSVAWSFQSNYARNMYGQMTVGSRIVYFFYVLLAVLARITMIILLLLTTEGDENPGDTGAQNSFDTHKNWNKIKHEKISKFIVNTVIPLILVALER